MDDKKTQELEKKIDLLIKNYQELFRDYNKLAAELLKAKRALEQKIRNIETIARRK